MLDPASLLWVSLMTAGSSSLSLRTGVKADEGTGLDAFQTAGSSMAFEDTRPWENYLGVLSAAQGGPIPPFRLKQIRDLWGVVERCDRHARYPHATVTPDGGFVMSWDKGRHHFEIEVDNSGTYGWFYMDRESSNRAGEEEIPLGSYSPGMLASLRRAVGEERWS